MKNLILAVIAVCGLGTLVGCSSDDHQTSTTATYESAQYDSKNVQSRQ